MDRTGQIRFNNCLYLTKIKSTLTRADLNLVLKREKKPVATIPIHHLSAVICLVPTHITPQAMALCLDNQVSISFLSFSGRFLGRVEGPLSGNVLLRREQYRRADRGEPELVRAMLLGKLRNMHSQLKRFAKDHPERRELLIPALERLRQLEGPHRTAESIEELRGLEGSASAAYFGVFDVMVLAPEQKFVARSRRPPLNPLNAALGFGYGLLRVSCANALEACGLDPSVGYLHVDRPGRQSLALDLMEEFRAFFVDRFVLALFNRRQLQEDDFIRHPNGAVELNEKGRKVFVEQWQGRKAEPVRHEILGQRVQLGMLPHLQARLLSRYLRGELEQYPPFLAR